MRDLKYLFAYIPAVLAFVGIFMQGYWTYAPVIFAFIFIPLFDQLLPSSTANFTKEEKNEKLKQRMFDWLLQVNIFMFFAILISFTYTLYTQPLTTYEIIGLVLSVGTIMGTSINVAHELGHRQTKFEQFLCKLMLMPNLYMHFFIEHNRGHHKNVATDEDPASSRKGEILYTFWFRSVIGGYLSAWNLETERLRNEGKAFFSVHNEMIWYHIIQVAYVITLLVLTSWWVTALTLWVGVMGVLLLETINYVEHYGLRRKKKESGRYERVKPHHSWNSNHEVGRIMLYELTRHSDHHFLASKKYQVLDHHAKAPHLPFGYPGSILMSTIPPLWFYVMHKELEKINPETAQLKSEFQVA